MTRRIRTRIERDFLDATTAEAVVGMVAQTSGEERIQAAILLAAGGDLARLHAACQLAGLDWRDLLVETGLDQANWPTRLAEQFGPPHRGLRPETARRGPIQPAKGGASTFAPAHNAVPPP